MDVGHDLDVLVAERVMGWKRGRWKNEIGEVGTSWFDKDTEPTLDNVQANLDFRPSTDWAAAGLVAERLEAEGYRPKILKYVEGGWGAVFYKGLDAFRYEAPTAPHAICLAAVAAKEG